MPIKSTKLTLGLCATVLFSGTVIAQDTINDDRFKPRVYGNLDQQPVQNTNYTVPTRNVVIQPVSTNGTTHVIQSSTPTGSYTPADVQAEAKRVIAFQNAAPNSNTQNDGANSFVTSERRYQVELFEPAQVQPSYTTATSPATQSFATHTVTNTQSHVVSDGDTLYNMAKRYDTTVDALRSTNNLTGNSIRIGQNITIPSTARHVISQAPAPVSAASFNQAPASNVIRTVQPIPNRGVYAVLPKDTLYSISKRACVTVQGIQAQNNLGKSTEIAPGQRLTMPQGHCLN